MKAKLLKAAVLDSSAILAVILNEPGNQKVAPFLQGGLLSTVNLAEVQTRLAQLGVAADHAWNRILSFHCEVCFFSDEQARIAAELITATKPFGLSLGDRACLALAMDRKARIYTTDRIWKNLDLPIEIEVIR